jgi:putative hydrolase of the HAD superfamily
MVIRGLVFDIDDTLYLERDYVRSGFDAVARVAATPKADEHTISSWLRDAFDSGIRGDTFDRLCAAFPEVAARFSTEELIDAYRSHTPSIELMGGMAESLAELRRLGMRLGVLSDGPAASQGAKAVALGLEHWFDPIILTSVLGAGFEKPATAGFERIEEEWGLAGRALVYVADNPAKDFAGPRRLGWATIRLRHPGQLRFRLEATGADHRPDVDLQTPADVLDWVVSGT